MLLGKLCRFFLKNLAILRWLEGLRREDFAKLTIPFHLHIFTKLMDKWNQHLLTVVTSVFIDPRRFRGPLTQCDEPVHVARR